MRSAARASAFFAPRSASSDITGCGRPTEAAALAPPALRQADIPKGREGRQDRLAQ